jgi:beta-barrel assembly-enhancing protease
MRSMPAVFEARLFDGQSARAQIVPVAREGEWLRIGENSVALTDLRRVKTATAVTLHRIDSPDWRLMIPADAGDAFGDVQKLHAVTPRHWRWIGGSVAAVFAVAAFFWFAGSAILQSLAPLVPRQVSRGVGEQYVEMFAPADKQCTRSDGRAALDKLVARITPAGGLVETITLRVVNDPLVNAFALPGGQVVLYRGLIDASETPEEVAGVLAHEFGHVERYHGNQALIRHFGVGVFLEGLGGDIGGIASTGLMLSNTRAAEAEADQEAIKFLKQSHVSSTGISDFFARMSGSPNSNAKAAKADAVDSGTKIGDILSTHPPDADRKRRFAEAAKTYAARPVLSDDEWKALKEICGS